jgi:hypothetical protein
MQKRVTIGIVAVLLALTGCQRESSSSGLITDTSLSNTTNAVIPELTAANSTVDCSGWAEGATVYLRNQGLLKVDQTIYGIGTFSCGVPDSELSTEYVESFIFTEGAWAGNGVVPGPRIRFMTLAPCKSAEKITCKAVKLEDREVEINGQIVISISAGDLSWRFEAD